MQLDGVTAGLVGMRGAATQNLGSGALLYRGGVGLPSGVAQSIGVRPRHPLHVAGRRVGPSVKVRAVLGEGTIGAVAASGITVALLPYAQTLTGQPGQVTNVLIRTRAG